MEEKIKNFLDKLYKSGRGLTVRRKKTYYPKKCKTCNNCKFALYDIHKMKFYKCFIFDTIEDKNGNIIPYGVCIPVKGNSRDYEYDSNEIAVMIEDLK